MPIPLGSTFLLLLLIFLFGQTEHGCSYANNNCCVYLCLFVYLTSDVHDTFSMKKYVPEIYCVLIYSIEVYSGKT